MSGRGALAGLDTPHPLALMLPGILQEDEFLQAFTGALDTVLAPVLASLDCFTAYLDPALAPPDFLAWLAGWVALTLDENWPLERQRELLVRSAQLYGWRGTAFGIAELIRLHVGGDPQVEDTGAVAWSNRPGSQPPGSWPPRLTVRVRPVGAGQVDQRRLAAVVAAAVPAHVSYTVEVLPA